MASYHDFETVPETKKRINEYFTGYVFIAPAAFFVITFIGYPVLMSLVLSLFRWKGAGPMRFVGLQNFIRLFTRDDVFRMALTNSTIFAFTTAFFTVLMGFIWAVIIDLQVKYWKFYRVAFFLPIALSFVVVALIWQKILEPLSIFNILLDHLHLGFLKRAWLGEPETALLAICWIGIWQYNGLWMIFFLAAMQNIDQSIYEAAKMDGASTMRRTFSITVPLCKNVFSVSTMLALIWGFRVFAQVWATTQGGPMRASEVMTTQLYRLAFYERRVGYASTLAIFMFLLAVLLSLIYFLLLRSQSEQ